MTINVISVFSRRDLTTTRRVRAHRLAQPVRQRTNHTSAGSSSSTAVAKRASLTTRLTRPSSDFADEQRKKQWRMGALLTMLAGVLVLSLATMSGSVYALNSNALVATVSKSVAVPSNMRAAPFNVDRKAIVPPGFRLEVVARIDKARFLLPLPNGDLLVSQPATGKVLLVRRTNRFVNDGQVTVSDFVTGLSAPHDMILRRVAGVTYLYIAETKRIVRAQYVDGDTQLRTRQTVVDNLPDASLPELGGAYGHPLKNIAMDSQNRLYVSIASASNADPNERNAAIERASIYVYNADGSNGQRFARGVRNAEGLAFKPGTDDLWVVVNNRDNIAFPYQRDFDGDGSNDYGKVMQAFVDNNPPELFAKVWAGRDLGWPLCNASNERGFDMMTFDRDVQTNANGSRLDCSTLAPIEKGIQAHSAPLGVSFLQDSSFAPAYRNGAVAGLHGSWNRAVKTGYKVTFYPWDDVANKPGAEQLLVGGFLLSDNTTLWGRPVDAVAGVAGDRSLYISDDYANAVYALLPDASDPTDSDNDGAPDSAEVEEGTNSGVRDNDVFTSNRLFVRQLYLDLFGRTADMAGLEFYANELAQGRQTRASLAAAFVSSQEYASTTLALSRLYLASFVRFGDPSGLRFWMSELRKGRSLADLAIAFSNNQELINLYGNLDNTQYVDRMYRNTLGRGPDGNGLTFWVSRLNAGTETRASLLNQFANSGEFRARRDPQLLPAIQATLLGNRSVSETEATQLQQRMASGTTLVQLINETIASGAYRARFLN
jgi:glucose/arabinose dehydrogenase